MKNAQRILATLLTLTFVFGSVAPAIASQDFAGDPVSVTIENKTGAATRITLTGPMTKSLNLATGKTKTELVPGSYKFSYDACGKTNTGTFKVKGAGSTLTLPKCKGGAGGANKTVTLTVINKTTGPINFVFTGPQTYYVTIPVGTTKVTMAPGKYTWSASSNSCGGYWTDTGNFNLKKSSKWTWVCA